MFLDSPTCDTVGKTREEIEEDIIAENIFDWWISRKSYAKWYAEKFQQTKLNLFNDEENERDFSDNLIEKLL